MLKYDGLSYLADLFIHCLFNVFNILGNGLRLADFLFLLMDLILLCSLFRDSM